MMILSQDLSFIINEVNDFVKKVNDNFLSNVTESLPRVECSSVSNYKKLINEFHNVRICLVKHNSVDYISSYDEVVKMYEENKQDISHLISLNIDCNIPKNKITWKRDTENKFDVVIETNINNLKHILISIMMDIILYRHFNLSNDLTKRKEFSIIKRDYILDANKDNYVQDNYRNSIDELRETKYLSISFPQIYLFFIENKKNLADLVDKMVQDYWKLIKQKLFLNIKLQNNYAMYDIENKFRKFSKDIQTQIDVVIPSFCRFHKVELPVLLAIKKDSSENDDCYIINSIDDFLLLHEDKFNFYHLAKIGV